MSSKPHVEVKITMQFDFFTSLHAQTQSVFLQSMFCVHTGQVHNTYVEQVNVITRRKKKSLQN